MSYLRSNNIRLAVGSSSNIASTEVTKKKGRQFGKKFCKFGVNKSEDTDLVNTKKTLLILDTFFRSSCAGQYQVVPNLVETILKKVMKNCKKVRKTWYAIK